MREELTTIIKREYKAQTRKSNKYIGLPTGYTYTISGDLLNLRIKNPQHNMQRDSGAFDAWALAIKRWVPNIEKIILKWDRPSVEERNKLQNYQRFLYRINKSTYIYDWLEVDGDCKELLDDFLIEDSTNYIVNSPKQEASESSTSIESKIELIFAQSYNHRLANIAGMDQDKIYRQLPVGVFKEKVAKHNKIFSAGAATIDLWGLNESQKELHLFELKAGDHSKMSSNKPMGIYSQLFFYTMIQNDLVENVFVNEKAEKTNYRGYKYLTDFGYQNIKSIKSHFLVDEIHPLIDTKMIDSINSSLKGKGKNIEFDIIKYKTGEDNDIIELYKV